VCYIQEVILIFVFPAMLAHLMLDSGKFLFSLCLITDGAGSMELLDRALPSNSRNTSSQKVGQGKVI